MVLALNAVVQGLDAAIVRLTELGGQDVLNALASDTINGWRGKIHNVSPAELCSLQSKILTTVTDLPTFCGAGVADLLLARGCNSNIQREIKLFAFQKLLSVCPDLASRTFEMNRLLGGWLQEWDGADEDSYEQDLVKLARTLVNAEVHSTP